MTDTLSAETLRSGSFEEIARLLMDQQARKLDVVAGASSVRFEHGHLVLADTTADLSADGVTLTEGVYRPQPAFVETMADKLSIPLGFLRRMHVERPDLFDALGNGLLHGDGVEVGPDSRRFLFRLFSGGDGSVGVARAMLGKNYRAIDHIDAVTAVLAGVREADPSAEVLSADLTDRRIFLSIATPSIATLAPVLLGDYHASVPGLDRWREAAEREGKGYGGSEPVVHAGIEIRNSEVGIGSFKITPRLVARVCANGLTLPLLAKRVVHAGAALDEGTVDWSADVRRKQLDLITATAHETVAHFLSPAFVEGQVREIEAKAGAPIEAVEAVEVVGNVGRELGLTEVERDGVFGHFLTGGKTTAGGIVNAITAYSQGVEDAERAHELDDLALRALDLVPVR